MAHIKMMEPEVAAAASVSILDLESDTTGRALGRFLSIMENEGFAIVTDVLDADEIATMEGLWAEDLRGIVDLPESAKRTLPMLKDPLTHWKIDECPLSVKAESFATEYGLPHGKMPWCVRAHPRVKAVFEKLFSTDALCVGMDNVFFNPNRPKIASDADRTERTWPHADQNSALDPSGKWACFQGVVYLWPADTDTSATVVWPGSHTTAFPQLMKRASFRGHFCMLGADEVPTFVERARRVPVPAGAMLLWNSRTIHQGWSIGRRLAVPVCFEPTKRRTEKALQSKIECCLTGTPTTHWASLGIPHRVSVGGGAKGPSESKSVPLKHVAHEHLLVSGGKCVHPEILALL